jgi:hypothetical protein
MPLEIHAEVTMKTLNISRPLEGSQSASRFEAAKSLAISIAESDAGFIEPELVAWIDRIIAMTSPELEGCSGSDGWHDYGVFHGGRPEFPVADDVGVQESTQRCLA